MRTGKIRLVVVWMGLSGVASLGCARSVPSPAAPPARAVPESSNVSEEECRAFADSIAKAVEQRDAAAFAAHVDHEALALTSTAGLGDAPALEKLRQNFIKDANLRESITALGQMIARKLDNGGNYKWLRVHEVNKQKRVLFRYAGTDGINYHDFVLARMPSGEIKAVDLYVALTGELMTRTLRRSFLPLAQQASRGFLDRLTASENEYLKHVEDIARLATCQKQGRCDEALRIYYKLPREIQQEKNVLLLRLTAAMQVNDKEYLAAIEDTLRAHGNDPALSLTMVDGYILKKQHREALECLDRVDKSVGGDPYLDVLRAGVHMDAGAYQLARQCARRTIAAEPMLIDPFWTLLAISLAEKKFDDTVTLLNEVKSKFPIDFADFREVPEYAEFVRSPQYQQWLQMNPKK